MFNVQDIKSGLTECIEEFRGEKVCIDITGGTELMTASGMMLGLQKEVQIIYMNLSEGYIFDVLTGERVADIKHVTVDDYLIAIGAKNIKRSHSLPKEKEYGAICRTAEYLFENLGEWHALHKYLSDRYADSDGLDFETTTSIIYNGNVYSAKQALDKFVENKFVERKSHNKYRFMNARYKEYMMIFGIWLEMYVYIKGKEFFDETHLGYMIDWDNSDTKDTIDNEIDILALRKSIPIFISCKMRKPEAMDLYEVAYLADRLGGTKAKGIVATTYPVSGDKNLSEGIFKKTEENEYWFYRGSFI